MYNEFSGPFLFKSASNRYRKGITTMRLFALPSVVLAHLPEWLHGLEFIALMKTTRVAAHSVAFVAEDCGLRIVRHPHIIAEIIALPAVRNTLHKSCPSTLRVLRVSLPHRDLEIVKFVARIVPKFHNLETFGVIIPNNYWHILCDAWVFKIATAIRVSTSLRHILLPGVNITRRIGVALGEALAQAGQMELLQMQGAPAHTERMGWLLRCSWQPRK